MSPDELPACVKQKVSSLSSLRAEPNSGNAQPWTTDPNQAARSIGEARAAIGAAAGAAEICLGRARLSVQLTSGRGTAATHAIEAKPAVTSSSAAACETGISTAAARSAACRRTRLTRCGSALRFRSAAAARHTGKGQQESQPSRAREQFRHGLVSAWEGRGATIGSRRTTNKRGSSAAAPHRLSLTSWSSPRAEPCQSRSLRAPCLPRALAKSEARKARPRRGA
jgi:hypothetical protein